MHSSSIDVLQRSERVTVRVRIRPERRRGLGLRVPADARPPVVHEPRRVLESQTDVVLARVLAQPVFFCWVPKGPCK